MALVSVIIPTHDRPASLVRAVMSAQSAGRDVEVIVVDDASADQTAAVCATLENVRYIRLDRNQGVAGARNVGLVASKGDYLTFLDDDDVRLPGSIDKQKAILDEDHEAMLVYAQAIPENSDGKQFSPYPEECPEGDVLMRLLSRNFIPCGSVLFRRTCLSRIGLLDDEIPGIDDWDLWIRIAEMHPVRALPSPVLIWQQSQPDSGQLSSSANRMVKLSVRQFRRWMRLPRMVSAPSAMRTIAWRDFSENMGEHLAWESMRALRSGNFSQSLKNLCVLPQLQPLTVFRLIGHRVFKVPRRSQELDPFGIQSRTA